MRVCLDTNVLVQVFTRRSPFNEIREALLQGRITLVLSNEILFEYEEVITNELGVKWWRLLVAFLESLTESHGNVVEVTPHYHLRIIEGDPDDDKFVDCAIAGGAVYVVTYDRHFDVLSSSKYACRPVTPEDLVKLL